MSVGIVRYPGSNGDFDALNYFEDSFFIWHKETQFPENMKLLVIPGGFAFGDRLYDKATDTYTMAPGGMAINSPITVIIKEAARRKIPILGICNGFQILIQLGLLPGKLLLNNNGKFTCKQVNCRAIYKSYITNSQYIINNTYDTNLYIANSYGKYTFSMDEHIELCDNQIFLTYNESLPEIGSYQNIAGICNKEKTIFGMMPHPERNNQDFKSILNKILFCNNLPVNQLHFHNKITELMHSEHISYKSTRKYLKKLHTTAPWVIQGPGENAGIVDIGGGYAIAIRIESHNHPTFINPFEGAATGVGGILRDIFTMGARPIAILDFLRFGSDENSRRLLESAIDGISYYGNCVGVPNIGGDCYIGESYNKNPLVNVACLGLVKTDNIIYGDAQSNRQFLIYVGSKTGNEGIGGAAMASAAFDSETNIETMQHNVQKSDPFLEKLLLEACCEITEKKLAAGMQDMGAGGLLCATYEVVNRGRQKTSKNLGCDIFLHKVPIKYQMDPCNILISESQERMLIVAEQENIENIKEIFNKWDLESAVIGAITDSGMYSVYNMCELLYTESMANSKDITQDWELTDCCNLTSNIKVKNMDLWKVYDSTVGNRTLKGPDKSESYAILDIPENGKQLVLTWAQEFSICHKKMIELTATPLCIVNCLNYGHPKDSLKELIKMTENLTIDCTLHQIPVVGGNVSLYNSTDDKSITPTPVLLMLGIL
jgi:phosphoribosylformylglycinamidine (FGAM) synthase-like amidotransferase family enzyme/selenophosphate synthetase-related protein